jgi:succinoglycan biosynthesis transport protein ExoP
MLQITKNMRPAELPTEAKRPSQALQFALNFVRRQYVVIAVAVALSTLLGVVYLMTTPPTFTAYAKMMIDTRRVQVFQQQSFFGDLGIDSAFVESQVEVLKSENIAQSVVKENHLAENPDFVGSAAQNGLWGAITGAIFGAPPPEVRSEAQLNARAVASVMGGISVKRVGLTYVIEVGFHSNSPDGAAQMANAVVDAYIRDQLDAKYVATRRASAWLQDRIGELKEQSSNADRIVEEFKQKNNMITADGKLVNEQQLAELSTQLVSARKRTADAQSRLDRIATILRGDAGDTVNATVSDSLSNNVVNKLREKYLDDANREADWTARFGQNHLAAVNLRNQMKGILASIREELIRLAETYKSDLEIAKNNQEATERQLAGVVAQSQAANQVKVTLHQLESTAKAYRTQYDSFLQKYTEAVGQQSFPNTEARVISAATAPGFKSSPVARNVLSFALLGGLLLGAGVGWLRESWYRVFRTSKDVEDILGKDSISLLPMLPTTKKSLPDQLETIPSDAPRTVGQSGDPAWNVINAPFSRYAEEVRSIKLAIDVNRGLENNKVVAFTSSVPEEGKSTTSTAVALLVAQTNARVILVDCDLRHPSLSRRLAPRAKLGLLDVLSGNASLDNTILRDPQTKLAFMPTVVKSRLANSSEILASDAMKNLFERLREQFDYIVVDLSPLVPIVDVRSAPSFVDAYVLIVEWGATSIDTVQRAVHSSRAVYDKLIGVVLNKVNFKSLGHFEGESGNYYKDKLYARYGYVE